MRILITAGPTREFIDPVRFISNLSTGVFGYEIAKAAAERGHKVTLISGPANLTPPKKVKLVPVLTALQMKSAVDKFYPSADCLIMSAAVADYRPVKPAHKKIKKTFKDITVKFQRNPDILLEAGKKKGNRILVGFSLETGDVIRNAKEKLKAKNLDLIVANTVKKGNSPFGDKKTQVIIINREGKTEKAFFSKKALSQIILDKVEGLWYFPYIGRT